MRKDSEHDRELEKELQDSLFLYRFFCEHLDFELSEQLCDWEWCFLLQDLFFSEQLFEEWCLLLECLFFLWW